MQASKLRLAGAVAALASVFTAPAHAEPSTMVRVSVASQGETDAPSGAASVSADGRLVAFSSTAGNLVAGDTNGVSDVFVRDVVTGTTERVSVSSGGAEANALSETPDISADGRYIAFRSVASNIVPGAAEGIYVRDRATATTDFVSLPPEGEQPIVGSDPSMSADGMRIAFTATRLLHVDGGTLIEVNAYLHDTATQRTTLISLSSGGETANNGAGDVAISADGSTVAFVSPATNLAPGTTGGRLKRVYVRDLVAGTTEIVSISGGGSRADDDAHDPSVSGDGRLVVHRRRPTSSLLTSSCWKLTRTRSSCTTD